MGSASDGTLNPDAGPHPINKCIVSDSSGSRMDVLDVRSDIHPRCDLEIVKGLDALSVAWAKHGLRKRTEFIRGANIVPSKAELIATFSSDRAVSANSRTKKVCDGRWIRIADGRASEQAVSRAAVYLRTPRGTGRSRSR